MKRFAAALPFTNFARFDFREDDRELERLERRPVFFRRFGEEREARFLRRRRPPPGQLFDVPGIPGHPLIQLSIPHLGPALGARCNANSASSSGSS